MYKEFRAHSHTLEGHERFVIDISEIRWGYKLLIMPYAGSSFIVSPGDHHVEGQEYVEFRPLGFPFRRHLMSKLLPLFSWRSRGKLGQFIQVEIIILLS